MKSKVSVIIPTFNRPTFLECAVRSALTQTYPAHDILIIDDGSDAAYQEKIKGLAGLSPSISIYHFYKNRGVSAARNFGLSKATGDFVLFLDDDDLLHPQFLESNLECFDQNPDIDIVSCRRHTFYSPNTPDRPGFLTTETDLKDSLRKADWVDLTNALRIEKETFSEILRFGRPIHSCVFRKKCLEGVNFPIDLKVGEDTFVLLSLVARGCRVKINPSVFVFVRWHSNNFRLRAEFDFEYIRYLRKLQSSGILNNRDDQFICRVRLFLELAKAKKIECLMCLAFMLRSPDLVIKYLCMFLYVHHKKRQGMNGLGQSYLTGMEDLVG